MKPLVDAMRNQGKSVAIAPEGTRSITPKLAPFKKGPFHLAMQAGVPVVPVVIHNAGDVAPKGDFVFRQATVEVDVLPPVDTSNWRRETVDEHVEQVRDMFLRVLGQAEDGASPAPVLPQPGKLKKGARKKKVVRKKVAGKKVAKKAAAGKASRKKAVQKKAGAKASPAKTVLKKKALKKKARRKKAPARKNE